MKNSAGMYESSSSKVIITNTGTQSGPSTFDESRFVTTFLTTLGVTEMLCSFWLILEGKEGKEIPKYSRLDFLKKFSKTILLYQM